KKNALDDEISPPIRPKKTVVKLSDPASDTNKDAASQAPALPTLVPPISIAEVHDDASVVPVPPLLPLLCGTLEGNLDVDGIGNVCEGCEGSLSDIDGDDVLDACDNCPQAQNENQFDGDNDGIGDICDTCPNNFDPTNTDSDFDGQGNACDNAPQNPNPGQED